MHGGDGQMLVEVASPECCQSPISQRQKAGTTLTFHANSKRPAGNTSMIMPVRQIPDGPLDGVPVTGESSLAERVRIRLLLEPDLPSQNIRCHVFHGTAVLCGIVASYRIRQRAQDALRLIPGLSLILNELIVWPTEAPGVSSAECRSISG
ncbi:MAG: BON domain-containing protein [Planctomycetota bacterium]